MQSHSLNVVPPLQFIRAGAGAGKTTRLIATFLDFVKQFRAENNGRFPRVVMTTFTRKATQEVKERLLVSALGAGESDVFEYINKKSYVQISTIHGLLSIFIGQHADRLKFPQEIRVIDGQQYQLILKKQINSLLKSDVRYIELLEHYKFTELVSHADAALEFKSQHSAFNYCSTADLKKIAFEKQQEIAAAIQEIFSLVPDVPEVWQETFRCLSVLLSDLEKGDGDSYRRHVEEFPDKPKWSEKKPSLDAVAHELFKDFRKKYFENAFDSSEFIAAHEALNSLFYDFINDLSESVLQYKRSSGELTISDLETLSVQLLEQFPDAAREFSNSWDFFMIDEYQDTSPLQVRILNRIVQNRPCFIVGDPQQSIYLFRGARSEVFNIKQKEMEKAGANISFLETNYRSEPSLMNFINDFFTDFSPQFKPMLTKSESSASKKAVYDAHFVKGPDQRAAVIQQIRYLYSRGVEPQDICVLSRSNSKLVDIAIEALNAGIHVQLQAAAGFENKREILDLISFNRFLNNPHDSENLVSLLRTPWFYLSDEAIISLSHSKNASLWQALLGSSHSQKSSLQQYLKMYAQSGSSQTTRRFVTESSFVSWSAYYDKTGKREANIFKFITALAEAEENPGFSLGMFLEDKFQSLNADLGNSSSEAQPVVQPNCVSLMTVHASKGLQFKHVIVIGFADQPQVSKVQRLTLDDATQKMSLAVWNEELSESNASGWAYRIRDQMIEREYQENERLLYVALTRAIESLSLVFCTDSRLGAKSWFSKMQWPEVGEHIGEKYKIISTEVSEVIEKDAAGEISAGKAREKFGAAVEGAAARSVTEILDSKTSDAANFGFETALANLKKAQRGTDLHRLFESMKYVDAKSLAKNLSQDDQQVLNYLLLEQKDLNIAQLLKHGANEWGFGLKTPTTFIQGQIDLWCELENEIHVLDYKTGSSAFADKAFEQLAIYTMALASMKAISANKKIVHSVVYPIEKVIRKKEFADVSQFKSTLEPKILQIFS